MNIQQQYLQSTTRRHFLGQGGYGLGGVALASLMGQTTSAKGPSPGLPNRPAKVKRVIYLHMAGSPPQHDMFDYKPKLVEHNMQPCPDELLEVLKKERLAFINLKQGRPKLLGTPHKFAKHGESGQEFSELLPNLAKHADDLCIVKSMWTDQFNHAPAQLFLYTGSPRFGGASMGSWITYGLGSENENLPGFVVLISGGTDPSGGKSLWGSGFLPSVYQGVQCRTVGEPILYVSDPKGMPRDVRRRSLDAIRKLNQEELERLGDPETEARISQYELAFRMQMAVPEVMDMAQEPKHVHEAYGTEPGQESFANNCLLARRMVESGVRYVQLFHYGWDMHGTNASNDIAQGLPGKCKEIDRPISALLNDLKERGMLDETLVIWSGEFGRTPLNEERNKSKFLGRDHHPHCFTIWMAGGGVKAGYTHGQTDDLGYFVTDGKVTVHDLQATMLNQMGIDPYQLKFPYQGLDQRLIGPSNDPIIQQDLLA
ncbi:MAG: DUF1501 domain-containing protein [Planctomycetaceae bacterium]|nr:DUF1501 domain-containing protein [Planctomycetaceae bacterium]